MRHISYNFLAREIIFFAIFKGILVSPLITSGVSWEIVFVFSKEFNNTRNRFFPKPCIDSNGDLNKFEFLFCF